MKNRYLVIAPFILISASLAGCWKSAVQGPQKPPPPVVQVSAAVEKQVSDFEEFTGRTDAVDSINVVARATGYLMTANFKEGALVKKGDILFEIDPHLYQALYDQATAQVKLNEAQLRQTKFDNARSVELAKTPGAISKQDVDKNQTAVDQAAAALEASKATQLMARIHLDYCHVKSQIDGRVSRYFVTPGNLVTVDETLLTSVVSQDPVYVYFDVDERTWQRIQQSRRDSKLEGSITPMTVRLALTNEEGFPHEGTVNFKDNRFDSQTGTLRLRGVFPNGDDKLTPGLFARVRLAVGPPHPAIVIPERALALINDQGRRGVYVVNAQNVIERKDVDTGALHGQMRVIDKGLAKGDRVVVNGIQRIMQPGVTVKPEEVPASEAAKSSVTSAEATPAVKKTSTN